MSSLCTVTSPVSDLTTRCLVCSSRILCKAAVRSKVLRLDVWQDEFAVHSHFSSLRPYDPLPGLLPQAVQPPLAGLPCPHHIGVALALHPAVDHHRLSNPPPHHLWQVNSWCSQQAHRCLLGVD